MQWRGWINDGITKPPDGPLWRDIGYRVCPVAVPEWNGDWGGFRQLPDPRRSENPPAARFSYLSFSESRFLAHPHAAAWNQEALTAFCSTSNKNTVFTRFNQS